MMILQLVVRCDRCSIQCGTNGLGVVIDIKGKFCTECWYLLNPNRNPN